MENEKRLSQLFDVFVMQQPCKEQFLRNYFGNQNVKWFYFDLAKCTPATSGNEMDITVNSIENPANVHIDLNEQATSNTINYGRITQELITQIRAMEPHDNRPIEGIALTIGKTDPTGPTGPPAPADSEPFIILDLYILRGGVEVIISTDGPGGENLTPTSIPPGK